MYKFNRLTGQYERITDEAAETITQAIEEGFDNVDLTTSSPNTDSSDNGDSNWSLEAALRAMGLTASTIPSLIDSNEALTSENATLAAQIAALMGLDAARGDMGTPPQIDEGVTRYVFTDVPRPMGGGGFMPQDAALISKPREKREKKKKKKNVLLSKGKSWSPERDRLNDNPGSATQEMS
jgi:hypothetical protein